MDGAIFRSWADMYTVLQSCLRVFRFCSPNVSTARPWPTLLARAAELSSISRTEAFGILPRAVYISSCSRRQPNRHEVLLKTAWPKPKKWRARWIPRVVLPEP